MSSKPLRFAAFIRVSTEAQAEKGESLRTQTKQIEEAVASLGGRIVARYGGQEHATPDWEHAERDRMVADACAGKCDAIMVVDESRWSRDEVGSGEALKRLQKAGVRFFVLTYEKDLADPTQCLYLAMSASIGKFHADHQAKKSIINKMERAKRGIPTNGKLPFGRTWDKKAGKWVVDAGKQSMVRDAAKRYIAGTSLEVLAREYNISRVHLCKVLRERSGPDWSIRFYAPRFKIDETVQFTIPPLLDEVTIRKVRDRLKAKSVRPVVRKHRYLLGGRIFCAGCGYCLEGHANVRGTRFYRHPHPNRMTRDCPLLEKPWTKADRIEEEVIHRLFNILGNPAQIERAIKAALPDRSEATERRKRLEAELAKIDRGRSRILELVEREALEMRQAEKKLIELKDRESMIRDELDKILSSLADAPDDESIRMFVETIDDAIFVTDEEGNTYLGGNDVQTFIEMSYEDRRNLIDRAFSGLCNGKPAGVYIKPEPGSRHRTKALNVEMRGMIGLSQYMVPESSS